MERYIIVINWISILLRYQYKIIKLSVKRGGGNLCALDFGSKFLDAPSKAWFIIEKMINYTFSKWKNFGSLNDTHKRQCTDWDIYLQVTHPINHLYQNCIKRSHNSIIGKQTIQLEKWTEYLNRHFIIMWAKKDRKAIIKKSSYSRILNWSLEPDCNVISPKKDIF